MVNEIFLEYRTKVVVDSTSSEKNEIYAKALMVNAASLGFTFSKSLLDKLSTLTVEELTAFGSEIAPILKDMVGAHVKYRPLFLNFPADVPTNMDEWFLKRIISHFATILGVAEGNVLSCGHVIDPEVWDMNKYGACPVCNFNLNANEVGQGEKRPPLNESVKLKIIDLGTEAEFKKIFTNLVGSNSSISDTNRADLRWFVGNYGQEIKLMMPANIPQKEQLSFIAGALIEMLGVEAASDILDKNIKTATDVLRLAVSLSGGDTSLSKDDKFRNFTRGERRFFLGMLEKIGFVTEDMLRYRMKWVRLGEKLHPGEYKARFPKTVAAFDVLRKDLPFETFNAKVEKAISGGVITEAVKHLMSRPGDFARRLDDLLRDDAENAAVTVDAFLKVSAKVSTPVLLQIFAHFRSRFQMDVRAVMPKGKKAKIQALEVPPMPVKKDVINKLVTGIRDTLVIRFKEGEPLGKVFVEDGFDQYLVPFSQRTATKSLRTIVRGSKIPLGDKKFVRFFLWWKDADTSGYSGTDIDLSATFYGSDWRYLEHASWTALSGYGYTHSGDIRSAPNGAAEFIDLDKAKMMNKGVRYVVLNIYSYSKENFCDLPECFAGVMERDKPSSGKIFDARTVKDKFDLAAETTTAVPAILDLQENVMVWCDLTFDNRVGHNTVENTKEGIALLGRTMMQMNKVNMKELALMHVEGRGELVDKREDADVVFALEGGNYSPFDVDKIMADLLA